MKYRGSEQQETTSILRSEGPKGRVYVFRTTPTRLDHGSGSVQKKLSHRDNAAAAAAAQDRGKGGKQLPALSLVPPSRRPPLHLTGQTRLELADPRPCGA